MTNRLETFRALLDRMSKYGSTPALTDASDGRTLTYEQLCVRAGEFSERLPSDIPTGARVVLYDLNPLDWSVCFFAIQLRGLIAVPLDTRVSVEFIQSVEKLTSPSLVLTGDHAVIDTHAPRLIMSELTSRPRVPYEREDDDANAPAEIIFTSGTWSQPKGVVLSQKNILSNADQILGVYKHSREDVSLAILPLSHAYQQTAGFVIPFLLGSRIVFLTTVSSEGLTSSLARYSVATMLVVPRVLALLQSAILRRIRSARVRMLVARIVRASRFLPRRVSLFIFGTIRRKIGPALNTLIVGGAPLSPELDHFFQGLGFNIVVGYGASECAPVISISLNQRRAVGEVGVALPGVSLEINDASELVVRGDNVYLGYWPHMNSSGFFNTEDVAEKSVAGVYTLKGRTKNLIIFPSGDKVFSEDIEYILNAMPEIEDSCVVSCEVGGVQKVHCVIRGSETLRTMVESIRSDVNARLPFGVRVDTVHYVEQSEFPYTHTLKPHRQKVLALVSRS